MWEALETDPDHPVNEEERRALYTDWVEAVEEEQRAGRLPDDLDAAQLVLSEVCLTMGPFLLPQLTRLVTGKSVKDPEFLAQREEFLPRCLSRRLIADEPLLERSLLEDVDAAGRAEADDVGHAHLGALDLTVARLAAQLRGDLEHAGRAGHADRVTLREQTAGDVDRRGAVTPRGLLVDELARTTGLAEPQVVVVDELGGGEAVVQLHQVEVFRADARELVGLVGRVAGERVDVGLRLAALDSTGRW